MQLTFEQLKLLMESANRHQSDRIRQAICPYLPATLTTAGSGLIGRHRPEAVTDH